MKFSADTGKLGTGLQERICGLKESWKECRRKDDRFRYYKYLSDVFELYEFIRVHDQEKSRLASSRHARKEKEPALPTYFELSSMLPAKWMLRPKVDGLGLFAMPGANAGAGTGSRVSSDSMAEYLVVLTISPRPSDGSGAREIPQFRFCHTMIRINYFWDAAIEQVVVDAG